MGGVAFIEERIVFILFILLQVISDGGARRIIRISWAKMHMQLWLPFSYGQ